MRAISTIALVLTGIWSLSPVFEGLIKTWNSHPDYSHGFMVPLIAVWMLYHRRQLFDPDAGPNLGFGLICILIASILPFAARILYIDSLASWAVVVWSLGAILLTYGNHGLRWAWPSIVFLCFMIPLPFRAETALSLPLQTIATSISCWTLQTLGQPAFAEGHTIWLDDRALEVEQACSGLRIFVAIIALAFVYMITTSTAWWEKLLIAVGIIPVALIANATRIVVTGLLYTIASSEVAEKFSHDFAGFAMIPLGAALFGLLIWYLKKLLPEVEELRTHHTLVD